MLALYIRQKGDFIYRRNGSTVKHYELAVGSQWKRGTVTTL